MVAAPAGSTPAEVASLRPVSDEVVEVLLAPVDGPRLPRWSPGAHVDLVLPTGLTRPYSLAGDPAAPTWRLLVGHGSAGGSAAYIHNGLRVGDPVTVRGPRHRFSLGGGARYLFLASGTGIAPILPMVRMVRGSRIHPWALVHRDGSPSGSPLALEVAGLGDDVRRVSDLESALDVVRAAQVATCVVVCGSGHFVDAVSEACPPGVYLRRQQFDGEVTGGGGASRPFEVTLARRGETLRVEAGQRLIDVLQEADAAVPISCGAGICGACVVPVVAGEVDHRDSMLTPAERGERIVTCVSSCRGDQLVLDL